MTSEVSPNEEGEFLSIVDVPLAKVNLPTLVIYGARTTGKSTIMDALTSGDMNYAQVKYLAALRPTRAAETRSIAEAETVSIAELTQRPAVFGYYADDVIYSFPAIHFPSEKFPIVPIAGQRGLEALIEACKTALTLPFRLNIQLTLREKTDLETRVIARLIQIEKELPRDFDRSHATAEQKARIDALKQSVLDGIDYFSQQTLQLFDATYFNDALSGTDPRRYLRPNESDLHIVTQDIAQRIDILYRLWIINVQKIVESSEAQAPQAQLPFIIDIHHDYIRDACITLFGKGCTKIKPGDLFLSHRRNVLAGTEQARVHPLLNTVRLYAEERGLSPDPLFELVEAACVEDAKSPYHGRFDIYLKSSGPIYTQDIPHKKESRDFDVLGIISKRVLLSHGTNPRFIVENDIVKGIVISLTDTLDSSLLREDKYYELFIGYR